MSSAASLILHVAASSLLPADCALNLSLQPVEALPDRPVRGLLYIYAAINDTKITPTVHFALSTDTNIQLNGKRLQENEEWERKMHLSLVWSGPFGTSHRRGSLLGQKWAVSAGRSFRFYFYFLCCCPSFSNMFVFQI